MKNITIKRTKIALITIALTALSACNGTGASNHTNTNTPQNPPQNTTVNQQKLLKNQDLSQTVSSDAQAMLAMVNAVRSEGRYCGNTFYPAASPLNWSNQLEISAKAHAQDMANQNYFTHNSLDGTRFSARIAKTGYPYGRLAENISAGRQTAQAAIDGWLQSAGHCSNMMNADYSDIGMARGENVNSQYQYYWVQNFGGR